MDIKIYLSPRAAHPLIPIKKKCKSTAMETNRTYTAIIIDDEDYSLARTAECIARRKELVLKKSYTDPQLALSELLKENICYDFAFIDVHMPGLKGTELLPQLTHLIARPVYTTSEFVSRSPLYNPEKDNYLYKPFGQQQFDKKIDEILAKAEGDHAPK